jgi:hypothetical protein
MKFSHIRKAFSYLYVTAWFSMLLVAFAVTPSESAGVLRSSSEPVIVYVSIFIIDVDEISSVNQSFDANVYLQYRWRDPKLAHKGSEAIVRPLNDVWNPKIYVVNQQKIWTTLPEVVTIAPDGEVLYRQRIWGSFSQPLELKDFPFDRQVFSIQLAAVGFTQDQVELLPDTTPESGISQELSVVDWSVIGYKSEPRPFRPIPAMKAISGFAFSFEARREIGYFIVKVIIPLIFIVAMSWVVFWIDPMESGTQISVAITTMLTLIAYRFSIDNSLPKVSYLTRLDYFVLLSTILVFASLIEVIFTSTLTKLEKLSRARAIDRWMRLLFPLAFVIVTVTSLIL